MPGSKLWAVDSQGSVYSLVLDSLQWEKTKQNAVGLYKRSFKRISTLGHCAWGVAADQHVYMCVFHTDSPIRVQKTCYENERWSIFHGWGQKSLLGTDRWAWSSKDGKQNLPKSSFKPPSGFWNWESDWYIDESVPADIEGWQYAVDFPATFYPRKGKLSLVRRRKWARYMNFEGFDKWIRIPWDDESLDRDPLQDIAIGGTEMTCQNPSYVSVWGVTFSGKVLFREGVWNCCPEGHAWVEVPATGLNLTQLSVNSLGFVWGVSWDGTAVVRVGISHHNPKGSEWIRVNSPNIHDPALKLFQVAAGKRAVWALTRDGKIFFRKGIDTRSSARDITLLTGSGWVEMVGEFSIISVGPNDQVWGVGANGNLYVRTNVTSNELVGRKWKLLFTGVGDSSKPSLEKEFDDVSVCSSTSLDDDLKLEQSNFYGQHWAWISSGACNIDTLYVDGIDKLLASSDSLSSLAHTSDLLKSRWRKKVLSSLKKRNMKEVDASHSALHLLSLGSVHWSKRGKGKILTDRTCNLWKACHIKVQPSDQEQEGAFLVYYTSDKDQFDELRLPFREIICVNVVSLPLQFYTLTVHTLERTFHREPVTIALENENELNDWVVTLGSETSKTRVPPALQRPSRKAVWATSNSGDVFFCNLPDEHELDGLSLGKMLWQQTGGHLKKISAGSDLIVWGIGYDGKSYVYSGGHGGGILKSEQHSLDNVYTQTDFDTCYIFENQRWNPVEGFSDRLLPSDRWTWSDDTGVYQQTRDSYKLRSAQWKWLDDWQIDYTAPGGTDRDGWQYAVDFPRTYHQYKGIHDYVRRRKWKRQCRLETTGPWMVVNSDVLLVDVSVQCHPLDNVAYSVAVWAVSNKGDIFYRVNVCKEDPQGISWMHVPGPDKFVSVSVGYKRMVWALAVDGSSYLRRGYEEDAMMGTHWIHISNSNIRLTEISCGENLVAAIDEQGTLWHRDKVMPTFPEGLEWVKILEGISKVSVGAGDELWIVRKNDIELCVKAENSGPVGCQVVCVLSGYWNSVCIRGCLSDIAEAEECVQTEEQSDGLKNEKKEPVTPINPYKVDIFSFYNRSRSINLSLESEEDLDIEIISKADGNVNV